MNLYLDNAATTYPKPQEVYSAVLNYMTNIGANPGRGGYARAINGNRIVYECREALMNFFNFDKLENVVFTSNITASLNMLIKSAVKDGWHVITSSMEHNSVLRPLSSLKNSNHIDFDIVPCGIDGLIDVELFKSKIKSNTKLVVLSHSSNVIGTIQPLKEIGKICRENNIFFIIDSAQTAGILPIDFYDIGCNALTFTGHKGLMAPPGIGGFLIDDKLNDEASAYIEGGTGSLSESIIQPTFLPDKYESGTLNAPAIAGLLEGINFINREGINSIKEHEEQLSKIFIEGLLNMDSINLYGLKDASKRTAVISINSEKIDNSELSFILDRDYGIATRSGLHCAPLAHQTIGTFPKGTIRFSFGYFNDERDIRYCLDSINKIIKGCD